MNDNPSDNPESILWQVGDRRTITHTFTRQEIDAFAKLTGDFNPLHVDAEYANRSSAGGQVVHGMLAASFVSTLIGVHIPGSGALWNSFEVNWRKIVRIGDTLIFEAQVSAIQTALNSLELEIKGLSEMTREVYFEGKARVTMMYESQRINTSTLAGKRVLITGATGAVGGAICRSLAEAGCKIVMWGRDEDRLQQLSQILGEHTPPFQVVDLLDDQMVEDGLNQLMKNGGVDGIVHAAAAPLNIAAIDSELNHQYFRDHLQVEVLAFETITRTLARKMEPEGFIIAVLTQAILGVPPVKMSAYVTAKMAAWGLVRAMAVELGPREIRCNAVSPNMIDTPYVKDMSLRIKQVEAASNPLRRICSIEDVADVVLFLAGPQARYINGINLPVSGGARMP